MYGLTQTIAPTVDALTLDEVKRHLRLALEVTSDDARLRSMLTAATQDIQTRTGRQFMSATFALKLDRFPSGNEMLKLPFATPLTSVSSVVYLDSAGVSTTWGTSNYRTHTSQSPGALSLAYGISWPAIYGVFESVTITYVAGASTAVSLSDSAKFAILLRLEDMYAPGTKGVQEAWQSLATNLWIGDEFVSYDSEAIAC